MLVELIFEIRGLLKIAEADINVESIWCSAFMLSMNLLGAHANQESDNKDMIEQIFIAIFIEFYSEKKLSRLIVI